MLSVGGVPDDMKAEVMANLRKLVRHRRNAPAMTVPQFQRLPDFWSWYKYFMDSHNQEGVSAANIYYFGSHAAFEAGIFLFCSMNHFFRSKIQHTCPKNTQ